MDLLTHVLGQWKVALKLLDQMAEKNIKPDTICYSSAISACSRSGQLSEALQLLNQMRDNNIRADVIVFNSILQYCARIGDCELVQQIIQMMKKGRIPRDAYTYTAALTSCHKSKRLPLMIQFVKDMVADNVTSNIIPFNIAIRSLSMHGYLNDAVAIYNNLAKWNAPADTNTYTHMFISLNKENSFKTIVQVNNFTQHITLRHTVMTF